MNIHTLVSKIQRFILVRLGMMHMVSGPQIEKFYLGSEMPFIFKDRVDDQCCIYSHCVGVQKSNALSVLLIADFVVIVKLLSHVRRFVTPWTAACQSSLSFTICQSLLKLMFIESVMPSNHLILCHHLLLLPSVIPSIRVFSSELALCIR